MSPSARRAVARFALSRGLSRRRAAWLCTTPRSGMEYRSVRARQDRWLSAALRIVAREDPSWGYRLAGGYLRLRGWQLNDKRVFRLWRLNGLSLPPYRPRRKIRSGDKLEGPARHRNDVWAWILCMIAMAMQNRFVVLLSRMRQPAIVWRSRLAGTYNISTSKPR